MPKRTNDFQELVALIERALAPRDASVTESAEIEVDGLDTLREVDVFIQGQYGQYTLKIAVEARDNATRKLSIQAFDSFVQKYRGECRVLVDKIVLVSRLGFTKGVIEKAKKLDIELLTVDAAKNKDWSKIGPGKLNFNVPPHICRIVFLPPIDVDDPRALWHEGRMICSHGHDHGTPFQRANCMVFHRWFPSNPEFVRDFERQVRESPEGQGLIKATYPCKGFTIRYRRQEYKISSMAIHVHAISHQGVTTHCAYERQSSTGHSQIVHHLQGVAGGKKLSLLVPDGPKPPDKIVLRIDDDKEDVKAKRQRRKKRGSTTKRKNKNS